MRLVGHVVIGPVTLALHKTQFFTRLLTLLTGRPCFCLKIVIGLVGMTVDLAIGGAELMVGEVVISFSG